MQLVQLNQCCHSIFEEELKHPKKTSFALSVLVTAQVSSTQNNSTLFLMGVDRSVAIEEATHAKRISKTAMASEDHKGRCRNFHPHQLDALCQVVKGFTKHVGARA